MKTLSLTAAVLVLFALAPALHAKEPAAVTAASGLPRVGPGTYAEQVLKPRKGKVVVVSFWATWCLPCVKELPLLGRLGAELASENVALVLVNADQAGIDDGRVQAFLDRAKVKLPIYVQDDTDALAFTKVVDPEWKGQLPFMVIYDANGQRVSSLKGGQTETTLRAAIRAAQPGQHPRKQPQR